MTASLSTLKRPRGNAFVCIALGVSALLASAQANAQEWPSKQVIRIVSPYAPGGVGDTIFRIISPALEAKLNQRFIIDNRTGAAGNIGTADVVNAQPDGYTFLFAPTANFAVNQYLFKLAFDPVTQLDPVIAVANAPLIAVVSPAVTATNMKQLAEQISAKGSRFNYGSPGAGSPTHLAGASFSLANGNVVEHIAYRGTPPMIQAMLGNDVQLAFPTLAAISPFIKAGKLKPIAVMAKQRMPELPDVPTSAEAGFPQFVFGNWWILAAPKGTDPKIVSRLSAEIKTILADPAIKAKLSDLGHVPMALGPAETSSFLRTESAEYKQLIERTGIKLE